MHPTGASLQDRARALYLCRTQGHVMSRWVAHRYTAHCTCRNCGMTAVVTRAGIKPRPEEASRMDGGAPWIPCPYSNGGPA